MKNLIVSIFLLIVFIFGCGKSSLSTNDNLKKDTCEVVSQDLDIASVQTETVGGKPIQIINLADGKQLIFSEEFMGIQDLDLRINYMTYRGIREYQVIKDSLQNQMPTTKSNLVDLLAFNKFLNDQELKVITFEEYNQQINFKEAKQYKDTAFYIMVGSGVTFFFLLTVIILLLGRMGNKFNSFLADENKYVYIGRKNTS